MTEKAIAPKTNKKKKYEDWEVRNALDDLERAERVKENPELMKLVEKQAKKKIAKAIKELAKENKEKAMDYIKNHKDETIALVRKTIMDYIEEHKEEIIKYAIDALIKVVTNK